jgi:hypothetical protein
MNNEQQQILEYRDRIEKENLSRFAAVMVFGSAGLFWLWF